MKSDQDLYRSLRSLTPDQLWRKEVPLFNQAPPRERLQRVALIRAVGVAFAGTGSAGQRAEIRAWLLALLKDPQEKIRRYAATALPKIGAGSSAEREMLSILKNAPEEREKKSIGRVLGKIGGAATLDAGSLAPHIEQKVKARVLREEQPGSIRLDEPITALDRLRIHLRCRRGLENILRDEVQAFIARNGSFRIIETRSRCVALLPLQPFTLRQLFQLRCFSTVNLVLRLLKDVEPGSLAKDLAAIIASGRTRHLIAALTDGPARYRLEFVDRGHQRGVIAEATSRAYTLSPDLVNDPRQAPWSVDVHETSHGLSVELRPRLSPDPRMFYRMDDVDAASHPPLAACMAQLAGPLENAVVWDPFCGSGLELIECALRGKLARLIGSDASSGALAIAQANLAAANTPTPASFTCCDFRAYSQIPDLKPGDVDLVITNPPMGRRIRLPDPKSFFADFFKTASAVLKIGGRLIFPNPLRLEPNDSSLQLESRQTVDLGGFDCRLEVWRKTIARAPDPVAPPPPPRVVKKSVRKSEPWYSAVARGQRRVGKFQRG